jgi:predicted RecB family nuclease
MNYTYVALKKILNELVPEKYPVISNIRIIDDYVIHHYKVFLGVRPNDISAFDNDEVRDYVRHVSKYVLGDNETIQQILFYNPDN